MTQTAAQQPSSRLVSGHGLATTAADGAVLDVWFPAPVAGPLSAADASLRDTLRALGGLEVRRFGDAVVARTALGLRLSLMSGRGTLQGGERPVRRLDT